MSAGTKREHRKVYRHGRAVSAPAICQLLSSLDHRDVEGKPSVCRLVEGLAVPKRPSRRSNNESKEHEREELGPTRQDRLCLTSLHS